MAYYDSDETPVDYESLEEEANDHTYQIHEATGDTSVYTGIHPNGRWDYEVWVDGGEFGDKAEYFSTFSELREAVKKKYPNANWENVGW
jgi:pyruvate/2-oxoacid:ferredoxin oxidoreductase beta subunit